MATLQEIAYDILKVPNKYGEESTEFLNQLEVMKRSIKHHYALFVRRDSERNGMSEIFYSTFGFNLEQVDKSEIPCNPIGCKVLRSVNKIPTPIRLKSDEIFKFVGTIDRSIIFVKTQPEELPYTLTNDWTSGVPRYWWMNEYIYIANRILLKRAIAQAPYIEAHNDGLCIGENNCYTDDMEFPASDDIIAIIKKEILATGI